MDHLGEAEKSFFTSEQIVRGFIEINWVAAICFFTIRKSAPRLVDPNFLATDLGKQVDVHLDQSLNDKIAYYKFLVTFEI